MFRQAVDFPWVETIMFPYNIVETQAEALIARCAEKNIGFICMKPLAGGAIDDAEVALRFVVSNPNVSVVIPSMADTKKIEQNLLSTENTAPLTESGLVGVQKLRSFLNTNFCRRCNYCAPCTAGISIPMVFLVEGYFSRYHLKDWAVARYDGMDKTASDCIGCGVCEERCPYHLPIRQMMKKTVEVFGK